MRHLGTRGEARPAGWSLHRTGGVCAWVYEILLVRVDSVQTNPHGEVLCLDYEFVYFWSEISEHCKNQA